MTDKAISPLRRRMTFLRPPKRASRRRVEDMEVRGFTACTQRGYIAAVRNFMAFLGRSPEQADQEDLRRFQHHMRASGASAANMNLAVSALRFLFGVTLGRGDALGARALAEGQSGAVVGLRRRHLGLAQGHGHPSGQARGQASERRVIR